MSSPLWAGKFANPSLIPRRLPPRIQLPGPGAAQALQRAVALRRAGKPAESVYALREAITFSPQDGPLHYDLGLTLI